MQKRILVAEDDSLQRNLMSMFLGWHDFEVQTASDGIDAIRTCISGNFDVVLMDYRLPIIDGHSAAKLIRDFTRDRGSPPIIALTAIPEQLRLDEADTDTVFAAVEAKPWDPHSLLETIGKIEIAGLSGALKYGVPSWKQATSRTGSGEIMARLAPDLRREIALLDGRRPPGPVRILIVEDDDFVRSLLNAALRAEHYEVSAVNNGLDAIIELEHGHYDIALLDYRLPKIDGFVAAQLMGDLLPVVQRPRLIALTGSPESLRERDLNAACGFDAIVPKTAAMHHVLAAIERSVSTQRRLAEA
jgi:CheY-like chemotaxis protein